MAHELKSTFTSKIFNRVTKKYLDDFLGNFDLNAISETGTIGTGCKRTPSGKPVTGTVVPSTQNPFAYHVEIDQTDPFPARYRGVALRNDEGQISRIVGDVIFNLTAAQRREFRVDEVLPDNQVETTWVVTKP